MSTTQMSATEALDFQHLSVHNAVQAQLACPEASCKAYPDIFYPSPLAGPGLRHPGRREGNRHHHLDPDAALTRRR
jgi:hypothetical protein